MASKTYTILTFGCKVNQYESQGLREDFARRGFREVPESDNADVFVINSCTVTEVASKEAQRFVRRVRRNKPDAQVVLTGCASETDADKFEGVTVVRQKDKHRLAELTPSAVDDGFPMHKKSNKDIFDLTISEFSDHTRAFMKVEDGCDLNCSFCIIPRVRGTVSSRSVLSAVEEAKRLIGNGYREIVLTGVHLGSFGRDRENRHLLPELIEAMLNLPDLARVRLSSIEANEIDDPLIDLMADEPKRFCPHLHIPLQSGDDEILRAMRRRYSVSMFIEACERVAERVPDPAFTTDVIIGFPGETEAQFENSVELCRRTTMSRIHIFPYSPRNGTDAALMKDDVPGREKKRRLRRLKAVGKTLTENYAETFVGRRVDVLVEQEDGTGYTERYLKARFAGVSKGALVTGTAVHSNGHLEVRA